MQENIKNILNNFSWLPFLIKWFLDKDLRYAFERLSWSREQMENFKVEKFKQIVNYAYKYVPFYKNLYDKYKINLEKINTINDINQFPVLSKDELKKAILDKTIFSTEKRKWKITKTHTTGSTGVPMTIFFDKFGMKMREINTIRAFFINGVFPNKRFLLLWRRKRLGKRELLKTFLGLYKYIPVIDVMDVKNTALDKDKILKLLDKIKEFNPSIIRGYVSALWVLSIFVKEYKTDLNLEKIIASAEYLPSTIWDELEDVFKCPVINYYGGTEASPIACSTPNDRNLVVFEDFYLVNIVDENGKEKCDGPGTIIITDYYNRYMPLIRYEIGDIAEWAPGRYYGPFRQFKEVKGRINDVFVLPDGKLLFSHNWYIYFRDLLGLKCFKVIQEKTDYIKVFLVPFEKNMLENSLPKVKEIVEKSLGKSVRIEWNIVDDINLDRGDKFRVVESKINWRKKFENKAD